MTNLEIDRKLAEAMGYEDVGVRGTKVSGQYVYYRNIKENVLYKFHPTEDVDDAWKVAEKFGLCEIRREEDPRAWVAVFVDGFEENQLHESFSARDKSAPHAICKAALKVIEWGKSDE
jgi:hypothetical protein